MIELLQQLLKQGRVIEVDEDAQINNIESSFEVITISDAIDYSKGGELQTDTMIIADSQVNSVVEGPWKWQASVTNPAIWNRFAWS